MAVSGFFARSELTRALWLFGREHGHVLFTNKAGQKVRIPVSW